MVRVTIELHRECIAAGAQVQCTINLHALDIDRPSPVAQSQPPSPTSAETPKTHPNLMNFNLFSKMNWTSPFRVKTKLTHKEYRPAHFLTPKAYKNWIASFQDCDKSQFGEEEERKMYLACMWRKFRKDSLAWAASKGRVEHWSEFNKRNGKYLRARRMKPSKIWEEYQRTWLDLIGFRK